MMNYFWMVLGAAALLAALYAISELILWRYFRRKEKFLKSVDKLED